MKVSASVEKTSQSLQMKLVGKNLKRARRRNRS